MHLSKRIRTILYEDQRFSPGEIELIHTPAFQRLYDLHQLGLTDRVFVDASHSRLHHVLGVVEQAGNLMAAIAMNLRRTPKSELKYSGALPSEKQSTRWFASLVAKRIPAARLMGLLHDLTHAPYGHTLEDEIHLVLEKHDEPQRQADAFYRVAVQFFGWLARNTGTRYVNEAYKAYWVAWDDYLDAPDSAQLPEDDGFVQYVAMLAKHLITQADEQRTIQPFLRIGTRELVRFVKDLFFAMRATLFLEAAHKPELRKQLIPRSEYAFDKLFVQVFKRLGVTLLESEKFLPHRDAFMLDVIGNTICADLLDYARRDSVSAGLKLDYDANRIIENFTLVSHEEERGTTIEANGDRSLEHPFNNVCIRTALSIFGHKLRLDVPGELLNLLQVRYYVYERMLFHPTKCIAGAMLGSAVQLIGWRKLPVRFRYTGDAVFLHGITEGARLLQHYLRQLRPDSLIDDRIAQDFEARVQSFASTTSAQSCKELLSSRIVRVRDVKQRLSDIISLLAPTRVLSGRMLIVLANLDCGEDDVFTNDLAAKLVAGLSPGDRPSAEEIVAGFLATSGKVADEIASGLHLLSRLGSRQYYKSVFRLLPEATAAVSFDVVAKTFLDSKKRFLAEREIEKRSGLPIGTIVIHCPRSEGPVKTANVLITSQTGEKRETFQLREIGRLHPNVFSKHQAAVEALEQMYRSTWRLVVSVAPSYTTDWRSISANAIRVLYEIVRHGDNVGDLPTNDEHMIREILGSLGQARPGSNEKVVRIVDEEDEETEMDASRLLFLEKVGQLIENHEVFREILEDKTEELVHDVKYDRATAKLANILDLRLKSRHRAEPPKRSAPTAEAKPREPADLDTLDIPIVSKQGLEEDEDMASEIVMAEVDRVLGFYRPYVRQAALAEFASVRNEFASGIESSVVSRAVIVNRLRELVPLMLPGERVECNRAEVKELRSPLLRILAAKT